ncbi:hypothetical protein Lesp02_24550 [Lentzea sp. NBRC 105346]|uniref:AfsR/SARP family transcriptional regulator n=1 Tax=Lentzea sp. NBRC 105346 TaxID=3032205 RepID=UPI0024A16D7E|nr:AfsR/SARP family transcriptional regulator [Lentzea sp. NBRC 105346]GLZ30265.1 hypothetical protein Lesp02_24550 [Lentzea sp. NBRC 105346]
MRFHVLGEVSAWANDSQVRLGGPQNRAVLAILLLEARRPVPVHRIIDLLWNSAPPASARNRVQGLVADLRRAGISVVTRGQSYVADVPLTTVDLFVFRSLAEQARSAPPADAVMLLNEALTWCHGVPLADVELPELRHALQEETLHALETRIELELRLGRHRSVVPELARLTGEHPVRESLHGLLMLAQYRSGRAADALETYRRLSHRLATEYGISSGPELRRLQGEILRS